MPRMNRNEREAGHREIERRKIELGRDLYRLVAKQSRNLREIEEYIRLEMDEVDDNMIWEMMEEFIMSLQNARKVGDRLEAQILKRGR